MAAALASLTLATPVAAGFPAVEAEGNRFIVNTTTAARQDDPRVAATPSGDFVVTWTDRAGADGQGSGVFVQRFAADGTPTGSEFQVNTYTSSHQVVAGVRYVDEGGSLRALFGWHDARGRAMIRQFLDGVPVEAEEIQTNTVGAALPATFFTTERAAGLSAGMCYVFPTFSAAGLDLYCSLGIRDQPPGGSSDALIPEFRVNSFTPDSQSFPQACGLPGGEFVVAWRSLSQDSSFGSIFAQIADVDGNLIGTEFRINENESYYDRFPDVCCHDTGFIVAWEALGDPLPPDGSDSAVLVRRFASDGQALGAQFIANQTTVGPQFDPTIACDPAGSFIVGWSGPGINVRAFAADGSPLTRQTGLPFFQDPRAGRLAMSPGGKAVMAWHDTDEAGDNLEILSQRTSVPGLDGLGVCGDPLDRGPAGGAQAGVRAITASDALCVLQTAVGAAPCEACVCDVNSEGGITATDALLVLQRAVGQPVALNCPVCS